jgi:hypothetical protein
MRPLHGRTAGPGFGHGGGCGPGCFRGWVDPGLRAEGQGSCTRRCRSCGSIARAVGHLSGRQRGARHYRRTPPYAQCASIADAVALRLATGASRSSVLPFARSRRARARAGCRPRPQIVNPESSRRRQCGRSASHGLTVSRGIEACASADSSRRKDRAGHARSAVRPPRRPPWAPDEAAHSRARWTRSGSGCPGGGASRCAVAFGIGASRLRTAAGECVVLRDSTIRRTPRTGRGVYRAHWAALPRRASSKGSRAGGGAATLQGADARGRRTTRSGLTRGHHPDQLLFVRHASMAHRQRRRS